MCGRFVLFAPGKDVARHFGAAAPPDLEAHYNIAPTQSILILRVNPETGTREFLFVKWGLIPFWSKDERSAAKMINARLETAYQKPAFRAAFKYRRCLVPANGFYEWKRQGSKKQPFFFEAVDGQPLGFAGLFEKWKSPSGEIIHSATILTTEANELLRDIHDRMPVIVDPAHYDEWLDPRIQDPATAQAALEPLPSDYMKGYPVSPQVNKSDYEGADCILPLQDALFF